MIIEQGFRHQLATVHANIARENIGHISTLRESMELIQKEPEILLDALQRNVVLVERAMCPTPEEREVIAKVSAELHDGEYKSADNLLRLTSGYELAIIQLAGSVIDPGTKIYKAGIRNLEERMAKAIEIKVNGDSPHDNELDSTKRKAYDLAIWGHTLGATTPQVNIEFWAAHQVERTVTAGLKNTDLSWTSANKDWLLNISTWRAVSDVVVGNGMPKEIRQMWSQQRPDGLGWASEKRISAYREAYNTV